MFGKKKEKIKMPIMFYPFQIEKLKKIKGNLLIVKVGDINHPPTQKMIDAAFESTRKVIPKKIRLLVMPYYVNMEMLL